MITLNTNSQIQVDYSEKQRNIRLLQGEAHFEVAKDRDKPFHVYAGNGRAQAVGTAFAVYLKESDMQVLSPKDELPWQAWGRNRHHSQVPALPRHYSQLWIMTPMVKSR